MHDFDIQMNRHAIQRDAAEHHVNPSTSNGVYTCMRKFFAVCCVAAAAAYCQDAQESVSGDPTHPASQMAGFLRERALSLPSLKVCALVAGGDGENAVALIGEDAQTAQTVRKGAKLVRNVDGVAITLDVKSVTARGVELDGSTIPGTLTPLPVPTDAPPEFLVYIEAQNVPLEQLLRLVADQSGENISASADTARTPVSIFLRNVTAPAAVEEICRATGLWYRRENGTGIMRVMTMHEYEKNLGSFREEKTEAFTLLYPNVAEVAGVIYGLYPDRTLLNLGEDELLEEEENDLGRRFRRFSIMSNNGGSTFLGMSPSSSSSTGTGTGSGVFSYSRGGWQRLSSAEFLRQKPKLDGLAASEAKSIETSLAEGDTNAYENVYSRLAANAANIFITLSRKTNTLLVRTSDSRTMEDIRALIKRIDVPTPMVLLEVKVMELDITDSYEASFQYAFSRDQVSAGGTKAAVSGGFPGFDALRANTPLGDAMSFQVLTRAIDARIQLLAKDGKIKTLATPVILTANNEVSRIFDGRQVPISTGVSSQTVVNENSTVTAPTTEVEYRDIGTLLLITPNINADGTVTLRVVQENSSIATDKAEIPIITNGSISYAEEDIIVSRVLNGTFVAKDGMAIVAGGIINETEKNVQSRIPVLGSIPLLGWMFRSTEKALQRTELIVTIRPHVIATPVEGGRVSQELLDALSAHPAADGRVSLDILRLRGDATPTPADDIESIVK